MGMIAPWMAGIKGSWMSHAYLFSEWHNSALGYTENIYSKWLEEVYKQLAEANRAMGDRKCECEAWELKMHTIVKLVPVSVIIKTKDGKRDITELSRSFASMKVPDEGWLITNDGW